MMPGRPPGDGAQKNGHWQQEIYLGAVPEADRRTETDAFRLPLPYFAHSQALDQKRWQNFADFALQYKLIDRPVDVDALIWRQP
jgi:putative hydroxymethylpyrimidine transport system substrate-binding protein